ncbi:hypothetical protein A0H81_07658 [Grifola frondosa]|uniref:F-box domain-containing protein n=1 Tax=Grifola frondosa TaxID=5627 RepID=A0A1C7M6Z1_GRIFR|nr:hypothetical protein A0H81_07658 [Grifola frondosa]
MKQLSVISATNGGSQRATCLGMCWLELLVGGLVRSVRCVQSNVTSPLDGVQNFIAQRRDPQLQRRTLLDIPPEIHDMMMQVAEDVDATALGQTCRSLRAASARHLSVCSHNTFSCPFILPLPLEKHRNFFIREIDDLEGEDLHEVPPKLMNIYTQACVLNECRRVLNNIRIALSRIDILHNIKSLQICDFSSDRTWRRAQLPRNSKEYPYFVRPISLDIARVLSSAPKITKLAICKFVLSEEMFAAMSQMPVLETLELTNCSYRQGRWLTDIIPGGIPTVRNVMFGGVRYDDVWVFELLSLLPMVRSLSLMGSEQGAFFPSMVGMEGFLTRTHAFCLAERLIVRCFDEEVPYLRAWLFLAKQRVHGEHLNLTHFKLEVQDGGSRYERLTRSRLFDLIDVLKDAPLSTLALEGVSYAGLDAFTHIAEKCPILRALTVVYRQDWWHVSSMPCIWPRALWQYAYSLGDLRSLTHLGSNMAVEPLLRVRYWPDDFMAGDRFRGCDTREEDFYYEERRSLLWPGYSQDSARTCSLSCFCHVKASLWVLRCRAGTMERFLHRRDTAFDAVDVEVERVQPERDVLEHEYESLAGVEGVGFGGGGFG